jgi:hypothetical protein
MLGSHIGRFFVAQRFVGFNRLFKLTLLRQLCGGLESYFAFLFGQDKASLPAQELLRPG